MQILSVSGPRSTQAHDQVLLLQQVALLVLDELATLAELATAAQPLSLAISQPFSLFSVVSFTNRLACGARFARAKNGVAAVIRLSRSLRSQHRLATQARESTPKRQP